MLFNTAMVRSILEGRKTVTRRVIKAPYRIDDENLCRVTGLAEHRGTDVTDGMPYHDCPYHPGDILYVRETWTTLIGSYIYKADLKPGMRNPGKWRPSIHMPKEAARIFLRVTDVRVERLRDISEEQAQAEGFYKGWQMSEHSSIALTATQAFMWTWNYTIKPANLLLYGWLANPWVWVIEFKRISKEEAADGTRK